MTRAALVLCLLVSGCSTGAEVLSSGDGNADGDGDADADLDTDVEADADEDQDLDSTDGDPDEDGILRFSDPEPLDELNTEADEAMPEISADGLTIYFMSARDVGAGGMDIWYATRDHVDSPFGEPMNLEEVNTGTDDRGPAISSDGLTLYFTSDMAGGLGNGDIYRATRASTGAPFGEPENVTELNTADVDGAPYISPDGLVFYLSSDRPGGLGGTDTWMATRASVSSPFGEPTNVTGLNSAGTDFGAVLSADGLIAIFNSDKPGGAGDFDLWYSTRANPASPFGEPQNLTDLNTASMESAASIAPDGTTIYFGMTSLFELGADSDLFVSHRTGP